MSNKRKDPATKKQDREEESELQHRLSLEKQSISAGKQAGEKAKFIAGDLTTIISILKTESVIPETRICVNQALVNLRHWAKELGRLLNQLNIITRELEKWQIDGFKNLSATRSKLSPRGQKRLKSAIQAEQQTIMKQRTIHNIEKRISQLHQLYLKQLNLAIHELNHQNSRGTVYFLLQAQEIEEESERLLKRLQKKQKGLLRLTKVEIELVKKLTA